MKKFLLATTCATLAFGAANADEMNVGIILGFTGPIESLTPAMRDSAILAIDEVNAAGGAAGATFKPVTADSTCTDSAAAVTAAEGLANTDNVVAIVGADCSGVTTAIVEKVSSVTGVPTISPSATSPALSTIEDKDFFFRTAPSDARQGDILASLVFARGISSVAVTFSNSDYGKGFAEAFQSAYEALGGNVTVSAPHDDGKGDYAAEVATLQAAGGDALVVLGYVDQGGAGVIQAALDTGAFETFAMGDGMYGSSLTDRFGDQLDGSFGTVPSAQGEGKEAFDKIAADAGIDPEGAYTSSSYDAAAVLLLAAQAAGSTDRAAIADKVLDVANEPGEKILAGELAKGLEMLANGEDIDYVGATNVEFIGSGEAAGTYLEFEIKEGALADVGFH